MLDKFRKDSLMVDTPSIQGTKQESFQAWPQNLEVLLPPSARIQKLQLPRTGTASRLQEGSFDIASPNVEFEGSVYSNQRFILDVNRKDFSRFKKKHETLVDFNLAKRNMINWVQPELILTRTMMSLSRLFIAEESNAFNQIYICAQNPRNHTNGTFVSRIHDPDHENGNGVGNHDSDSLNGSHLDVVSSDSTPLRDSMVISRLNNLGISESMPFYPQHYLRASTDTLAHRLSGEAHRSMISCSSFSPDHPTPQYRRVDKKRGIKLYFSLDMALKRFLKRVMYRIQEYRDQKAVEQFNFQVSVFNKFTQTYKHHFVQNNIAIQTDSAPSLKSRTASLQMLATFCDTKNDLLLRASITSIKLCVKFKHQEQIEAEINLFQSKIARQKEWETINTGYKKDAQRKLFFCILQSLFQRKEEELLLESFSKIETSQIAQRLRQIAVKNVISFISRALNKQFTKFVHLALQEKPKLQFELAERIKGLCIVNEFFDKSETHFLVESLAELKLNSNRLKSRRSIFGMGRNSIPFNNLMNKSEKTNEGAVILDYITKRTFTNAFRSLKVFYRYNRPFLVQRGDAFGGAIVNFFALQRRKIFQAMKKFDEFKERKIEDAHKTVSKLERIFTRKNEVRMAFYYIKLSRTPREHSKHVKLGCIYMSKILECIFSRTLKNTFFELKLDQLGLSVVLSGIGLKVFGATSQVQLLAADKLSVMHEKQTPSVGTAGALNTSGMDNKDDETDDFPKKGRERGTSMNIDSPATVDPLVSRNQSVRPSDGSKPPLPHRSRFSLKPPAAPTNNLAEKEGMFLKESPIMKTADDKKNRVLTQDELVTRTPKPVKSASKVTQMGPLKGATPSARISSTPVGIAASFSALASTQASKGRGSVAEQGGTTPRPKK